MALERRNPSQRDLEQLLSEVRDGETAAVPIEEAIDYSLMSNAALKALKGKKLKEAAELDQKKERLRQNIYTKTESLFQDFREVTTEEFPFKAHSGEGLVTRVVETGSTPIVSMPGWDGETRITGAQLVERWKPIPGNNPEFKVHREHVKLRFIGVNLDTGLQVESTPYKIGIDDKRFVAEDRDNREADEEGLIVVSSAVNLIFQELTRPQNGLEVEFTSPQ